MRLPTLVLLLLALVVMATSLPPISTPVAGRIKKIKKALALQENVQAKSEERSSLARLAQFANQAAKKFQDLLQINPDPENSNEGLNWTSDDEKSPIPNFERRGQKSIVEPGNVIPESCIEQKETIIKIDEQKKQFWMLKMLVLPEGKHQWALPPATMYCVYELLVEGWEMRPEYYVKPRTGYGAADYYYTEEEGEDGAETQDRKETEDADSGHISQPRASLSSHFARPVFVAWDAIAQRPHYVQKSAPIKEQIMHDINRKCLLKGSPLAPWVVADMGRREVEFIETSMQCNTVEQISTWGEQFGQCVQTLSAKLGPVGWTLAPLPKGVQVCLERQFDYILGHFLMRTFTGRFSRNDWWDLVHFLWLARNEFGYPSLPVVEGGAFSKALNFLSTKQAQEPVLLAMRYLYTFVPRDRSTAFCKLMEQNFKKPFDYVGMRGLIQILERMTEEQRKKTVKELNSTPMGIISHLKQYNQLRDIVEMAEKALLFLPFKDSSTLKTAICTLAEAIEHKVPQAETLASLFGNQNKNMVKLFKHMTRSDTGVVDVQQQIPLVVFQRLFEKYEMKQADAMVTLFLSLISHYEEIEELLSEFYDLARRYSQDAIQREMESRGLVVAAQ